MIGTGPLSNQLSLLDGWTELRSPKVKARDREGVYAWSPLYSAFSEAFVVDALTRLRKSNKDIVLDPFVGCGTTTLAASKMGNPAIGIDLDPYSCILARAAVATKAEPRIVKKLLTQKNLRDKNILSENAFRIFGQNDIRYAFTVFDHVIQRVGRRPTMAWHRILNDPDGRYDSESVALAALGVGAAKAAKVVEGSNPVWVRAALNGERGVRVRLQTAASQAANLMLRDLGSLKGSLRSRGIRIINADIRSWVPRSGAVDIVITSP